MDRSKIITLVKETFAKDAIGQEVATETTRDCFCNVSSVGRQEFFQAGQLGLNPELVVTMFAPDYNEEVVAVVDNKRYSIYRTYNGKDDTIELYLERKTGV